MERLTKDFARALKTVECERLEDGAPLAQLTEIDGVLLDAVENGESFDAILLAISGAKVLLRYHRKTGSAMRFLEVRPRKKNSPSE